MPPDKEEDDEKPEWRDYLAIAIAMLQTIFLPIVVAIVLVVILALVLHFV